MTKTTRAVIVATLLACAPVPASAATITLTIGTFEWSQFFSSEDFRLENISSLAGIAADFTDVSLVVTSDADGDGTADASFDAFPPPGFSTTLVSSPLDNSLFASLDGPILSASLSFRFAPDALPELAFAQTFVSPDVVFIEYSYEAPDSEPSPVPEPASVLLLSVGAGLGLLSKRTFGKHRTLS